MTGNETVVLGIVIPSVSPFFLAVVGLHVVLGLACAVTGVVAMLSAKRAGRHPAAGTIYYWCLAAVFATAAVLAAMRWAESYHLFLIGACAFAGASLARTALRRRWRHWVRLHISGMGSSYVLLLIAFYVDNGRNLPIWKDLPPITYWLLPTVLGLPLIARALLRHPLTRSHPR